MAANALAANMALYQPPPFDAERDLVPVALIGRVPVVIAANPDRALCQRGPADRRQPRPSRASIAFAYAGQRFHAAHGDGELFARAAGISLMHVPYRGGAQAITDVIGGQVPLLAMNALEVKPHVAERQAQGAGRAQSRRGRRSFLTCRRSPSPAFPDSKPRSGTP